MPHRLDAVAEYFADRLVDRAGAEVLGPCNFEAPEIDRLRDAEIRRVDHIAQRIDVALAGLHGHQLASVGDSTPHRAKHRDRRPAHRPHRMRHEARRWPESDDAVHRARDAQRSSGIRSRAHGEHVGRQRHRRAARRAARVLRRIERIARRAPHDVATVGAGAELRHVGLRNHDAAGGADARHHHRVVFGNVVLVERRAVGRQQPARVLEILHADRQPVQRAERVAVTYRFLRRLRLLACPRVARRRHRIHRRVDLGDAVDARLQQLDRRNLLRADATAHFDGGQREQVGVLGHGCGSEVGMSGNIRGRAVPSPRPLRGEG